jgi:hypothetical protein
LHSSAAHDAVGGGGFWGETAECVTLSNRVSAVIIRVICNDAVDDAVHLAEAVVLSSMCGQIVRLSGVGSVLWGGRMPGDQR